MKDHEKIHIRDFTLSELEEWIQSIGEKPYRARQIFYHLYVRNVKSWQECTDLSKSLRTKLEYGTRLHTLTLVKRLVSQDGTEKFLFELDDGFQIETVLIPDPPRNTLCLSTQVGCPIGCRFCYTGFLGFKRNLKTGEIIDQYALVQSAIGSRNITNIVLMGMGEPLLNEEALYKALDILLSPRGADFSHRRITVSTVGIVPAIKRLGEKTPVNLAISLHAPRNELRNLLVPVNRKYPLEELISACIDYPLPPRKRITFEYVLIDGVNDSSREAEELIELLKPVRCKVNLIPYNPHRGAPYKRPSQEKIERFQSILQKANMTVTIRESRGADIQAACGQLAGNLEGDHHVRSDA